MSAQTVFWTRRPAMFNFVINPRRAVHGSHRNMATELPGMTAEVALRGNHATPRSIKNEN
jgi:hypothetical protein